MTRNQNNKGIWQYWQTIMGIVSFVFAAGVFYSENKEMKAKMIKVEEAYRAKDTELEKRQDRQFQLYQELEKRIIDLEKRSEYYRGLREARTNTNSN